jgi:hypothetical protein
MGSSPLVIPAQAHCCPGKIIMRRALPVGEPALPVNVTYLAGLGHSGLAASNAPAADLMKRVFGAHGATIMAIGIACSTFGYCSIATLFWYQRHFADQPLPYRVPVYPLLPFVFVCTVFGVIIARGISVYAIWRRWQRAPAG